jgi:hypothetical protein
LRGNLVYPHFPFPIFLSLYETTLVFLYRQGVDQQPISDESTQLDREAISSNPSIIMNASGENAKQIGQIGKIESFTM